MAMLCELRVENLLLIERAELRLARGLNVLTGETGAGKTVLAHALDLLLGGRAKPGIVRPGAAEAYVEGVFELPDALRGELGERLPADAEEVVLARRIGADGRTRALVNGRSATVTDLRELAEPLHHVLRPARAPQAHARRRPARDPRRLLRRAQLARRAEGRRGVRDGARGAGRARRAAGARRRARARARPARLRARRDRGGRAERGGGRRAARRARAPAPRRGAARRLAGRRRGGRRRRGRDRQPAGERRPRAARARRASTPRSTPSASAGRR